jgi:spermidine synthase
MAALIYELTWIRPLQFILGPNVYTISIIFAVFMFGLALGSLIISKYVDKIRNLPATYALMEIGIGLYGVLLLIIFNILPDIYRAIYSLHTNFYVFEFVQFVLIFIILLIPTTLMGATFPIIAKFYTRQKIGKGIGEVYSANNIGAIIGSFSAGFILIPLFGIKTAIIFAGSINLLIGFTILFFTNKKFLKKIFLIVLVLFVILGFFGKYNINQMYSGSFSTTVFSKQLVEKTEFLYYKEGLHSTVAVTKDPLEGAINLLVNGKSEGSTVIRDLRVYFLLSYLPLLLNSNAEDALVIGLGTGTTSGHLARSVKTHTLEIEPAILKTSTYFKEINLNVLENENHTITIIDARNYLLKDKESYDIISQDPCDPWQSSSASLYSKEFFELTYEHLNENGLLVIWVPIYTTSPDDFRSFYKTFNSVFPNVIIFANIKENEKIPHNLKTSELILVGSKEKIFYEEKIKENFDLLSYDSKEHLKAIHIGSASDLLNLLIVTNEDIKGYGEEAELVTDDNLKLELSTAKRFLTKNATEVVLDIGRYLNE